MGFRAPDYTQPTVISRFWAPTSVGEKLAGPVLGIDVETGKFGEQQYLGVRDPVTNRDRVVRLNARLGAQLDKAKPKIGQGVVVTFLGEDVDGRKGKEYLLVLDARFDDKAKLAAEALASGETAPF